MARVRYTARFPFPELLELGVDAVVDCPVYRNGALVVPTAGTLRVANPAGTVVVDDEDVTVTDGVATYTIDAADLPTTLALEAGWSFEWTLTLDDVAHVFRQDGMTCRRRLYPTIADPDVVARVRSLDKNLPASITTRETFQDAIDEADIEVQNRMLAKGQRPDLVARPSALRALWLTTVVAIVLEDLASRNRDAYAETAADWRARAEAAWAEAAPTFDYGGDGVPDAGSQRGVTSGPELWTC